LRAGACRAPRSHAGDSVGPSGGAEVGPRPRDGEQMEQGERKSGRSMAKDSAGGYNEEVGGDDVISAGGGPEDRSKSSVSDTSGDHLLSDDDFITSDDEQQIGIIGMIQTSVCLYVAT
jgi:hypothetical protein